MADKQRTNTTATRLAGGRAGLIVLVTLVYILLTGVVVVALRWPPAGAVRIEVATANSAGVVTVIVGGQVASPGVYTLAAPATVGDAITAAGGVLAEAATLGIDTRATVSDGEQVWVAGSGAGTAARIDINSASAEELDSLPEIGPTLAARMIAYREEHGPFSTVEELLNVNGIGDATLARIRPQIEVR